MAAPTDTSLSSLLHSAPRYNTKSGGAVAVNSALSSHSVPRKYDFSPISRSDLSLVRRQVVISANYPTFNRKTAVKYEEKRPKQRWKPAISHSFDPNLNQSWVQSSAKQGKVTLLTSNLGFEQSKAASKMMQKAATDLNQAGNSIHRLVQHLNQSIDWVEREIGVRKAFQPSVNSSKR